MMSSDVNSVYLRLREKVMGIQCSSAQLVEVKLRFEKEINSKRKLHAIKTLNELIEVLEKRDCLNCDNINPLKMIAMVLKTPIDTFLDVYTNVYVNNRRATHYHEKPHVFPDIPSDSKQRAYLLITEEIGKNWQEFARALGIRESKIDVLSSLTFENRMDEILRFHEQTCDRRTWRSQLLKALRQARRTDLSDNVQHIFDTC